MSNQEEGIQQIPVVSSPPQEFTFSDFFSGIGGMRFGLEAVGGRCVFSCEKDKYARRTYTDWFSDSEHSIAEDITVLDPADIPRHDLLAAGFPCQPFSLAGVSKKISMGEEHGFNDRLKGHLFDSLAEVISGVQPKLLLLENVKNLRSHDVGRTWRRIESTLNKLGYWVFDMILDASCFVPQHRERIFITGFRKDLFPAKPHFECRQPRVPARPKLKDILETSPEAKYTLSSDLWNYLQEYKKKHEAKGNGFGCSLASPEGITRTLSARYHKDGSEILISQGDGERPRRLTPVEAQRLMGFPEKPISVSDTQAYRQFGNAVVPEMVSYVARQMLAVAAPVLQSCSKRNKEGSANDSNGSASGRRRTQRRSSTT
jgi:DNA (cytosine-5)-methyltransferase 1